MSNQVETIIQTAANKIEVSLATLSSGNDSECRAEAADAIANAASDLLALLPTNGPALSTSVFSVIHGLSIRLYGMISSCPPHDTASNASICVMMIVDRLIERLSEESPIASHVVSLFRGVMPWLFDDRCANTFVTATPFPHSFQRLFLTVRAVYVKKCSAHHNGCLLLDHRFLSLLDTHASNSLEFEASSKELILGLLQRLDIKPQLNPVARPFCHKILIPLWSHDEIKAVRIGAIRLALSWIATHPCREAISAVNLLLDTLLGFRHDFKVHSDTIQVLTNFLGTDVRLDPLLAHSPRAISLLCSLNSTFKDHDPHAGIDIQQHVTACLSRLAVLDPASFLPRFRNGLMRSLADIESWRTSETGGKSNLSRLRMGACSLLYHLEYMPSFVCPYTDAIMSGIVSMLKDLEKLQSSAHDHPSDLESIFFRIVCRIAKVRDKGLMPHLNDLVKLLTVGMQDATSQDRRLICLDTIDTIVCLVDRQQVSIDFMATLWLSVAELLKVEQVALLRRKIIKLLGSIGSIDPYQMQAIESGWRRARTGTAISVGEEVKPLIVPSHQHDADPASSTFTSHASPSQQNEAINDSSEEAEDMAYSHVDHKKGPSILLSEDIHAIISASGGISSDDCYPMVAFWALLKVLKEGTHVTHQITALTASVSILEIISPRFPKHGLLSALFPRLMRLLRGNLDDPSKTALMTTDDPSISLIRRITSIVKIVRAHSRPYAWELSEIVANRLAATWILLSKRSFSSDYHMTLTQALLELALTILDAIPDDVHRLSPLLLPPLMSCLSNPAKYEPVVILPLQMLCLMGPAIPEHSHVIMDALTTLLQSTRSAELQIACLKTILTLTQSLQLAEFLPLLVPILCTPTFSIEPYRSLCFCIFRQLVSSSQDLSVVWNPILRAHRIVFEDTSPSTNHLNAPTISPHLSSLNSSSSSDSISSHAPNTITRLSNAWSNGSCVSKDDWFQWMRSFSLALLEHSPCPSLRALHAVALEHAIVSKELFNVAFVAAFDGLREGKEVEGLMMAIETAFTSSSTPPEICSNC